MDIDAYIASGCLDRYCLCSCSEEERIAVEEYAAKYPAIRKEIEKIRSAMEAYFMANEVKPAPSVKISLMRSIYRQTAADDTAYPPLINDYKSVDTIADWLSHTVLPVPATEFENLSLIELPSSEQVTNFFVYARDGHEVELHDNFIEYLYVIKGSCTMDFNGEKKAYKAGELITIMPHINHYAVVTSAEPMIALVQRQACA
ncbi:hypothetical protein BH11BAC4_BH11BAC4_09170 [soil metagenome]